MWKKLRRWLNDKAHAIIGKAFHNRYSPLSLFFGNFEVIRRFVGGSWVFLYSDETHSYFWECYRGNVIPMAVFHRPGLRGTAFVEYHPEHY